jgi:hypothetical protein
MMGTITSQVFVSDHLFFVHISRVAYAYINSWLTVFNDAWCQRMSTQVHGK